MELVNFKQLPKSSPFVRYQYVLKKPAATVREHSPVEFLIENRLRIYWFAWNTIVKGDGSAMTENDSVALVNLPLQSLWKHVGIYWQNRFASSSDQYYPWKSILDVLLNYSEDSK